RSRSSGLGDALVEADEVAVVVPEHRPPGRVADRGLLRDHLCAERAALRQYVVDGVHLHIRPRLGEVLPARSEPAAGDLVRSLPHRVALEAGHLTDLPAEQLAVEPARPVQVTDWDVDVRDVAVCHVGPPSRWMWEKP